MQSDKSICFVIVYFGKFPEYMQVFLEGCRRNKSIDWIIFHSQEKYDEKEKIVIPENVKIINLSKSQFIDLVKQKTGFDAKIAYSYKLIDFKPLYGHLFEKYLHNYAFWGITDLDVLYGSIRTFITEEILEKYDVVTAYEMFLAGHFTLFRNVAHINKIYLKDPIIKKVIESSNPRVSTYDERSFNLLIREYENKKKQSKHPLRVFRKDLALVCTDERWYFEWHKNNVKSHQQYYTEEDYINKPLHDKSMKKRNYGPVYLCHGRLFHQKTHTEHPYFHFMDWKKKFKIYSFVGVNYSNCYIDEQGIYLLTGVKYWDKILLYLYKKKIFSLLFKIVKCTS